MSHKEIALVIGSGGIKCAATLGLWKVFQREGIEISMAVGSSGGSLFAACIALGMELEHAEELTNQFWKSDLVNSYASNLRNVLSGESHYTELSGLVDDQALNERLRGIFQGKTFEDAHIPLHIVSTDLYNGESVVHDHGNIFDAVRSSIAIPMVFPPWKSGDRWLVDGAVSNPLPIDIAIKEGGDLIVALGFDIPTRSRMHSYAAVVSHFNSLYMNNLLKSTFAFYSLAHHAEIVLVIPPLDEFISAFDSRQIPGIIEMGARATEEQLPYINRLVAVKE